eukprot:scaffold2201_cov110-Isochrysis_galbana.AAC.1
MHVHLPSRTLYGLAPGVCCEPTSLGRVVQRACGRERRDGWGKERGLEGLRICNLRVRVHSIWTAPGGTKQNCGGRKLKSKRGRHR